MNWQVPKGAALAQPELAKPGLEARPALCLADPEGRWLCAWCHDDVARDKDRFRYEGKDEFNFSNPAGMWFDILTFSQTLGCRETGLPTLEHTWFPGHAWSYCQCGRCGRHLGWYFTGPHRFVGLIKNRLVRAVCVRN